MIELGREFTEHLIHNYSLDRHELMNLVEELGEFWNSNPKEFIQNRHLELQQQGMKNAEIYSRIISEMRERRFAAEEMSERQIRRIIYG